MHNKSLKNGSERFWPTPDTGHSISGHGVRGGKPGNGSQSGRIVADGKLACEATITYRIMNFPNPGLRVGLFDMARRVGVPAELMEDA